MKKKILIMFLLLVTVGSSAFSSIPSGMNEQVANSFKKEFTLAEDVKWETTKDLVKITFKLNSQVMFAYYTESGELMAVVRNISSVQLPIHLLAELKRDYNDWWITDLFEMAGTTGTSYYITLENADTTLVLKSGNSNGWQTYKKVKKITE
jgi:hypothetical protein